MHHKSLGLS